MSKNSVALATTDKDLGVVPAATATKRAQAVANELGKAVTVRHPVTDTVIRTVKPAAKTKKKAKAAAKKTAKAAKPATDRKPRGMCCRF